MQMSRNKLWIGTSWKMNKLRAEAAAFARALALSRHVQAERLQPLIIPPYTALAEVAALLNGTKVVVGAQNMHWADSGAWTGEISASMIKDCGASLVEIGHSERRTHFGETDATVALKTEAALRHGLTPLVCIGDTRDEYESRKTAAALERQVRALFSRVPSAEAGKVMIAYEPVWSIGEGGTPAAPGFVEEQHDRITALILSLIGHSVPILYGGSVNPQNCVALASQKHVDGLFIGRSAWDVNGYIGILDLVSDMNGVKT
jgi:L-erythrulose 1-phosphate isomerase